ncbi:MAG: protein-disulfide reductase DsbD family protein [Fuscovulum sp.]|nr:MAG: protein-disulfide reductase DsbD family protein [Fuscovulum sp.]
MGLLRPCLKGIPVTWFLWNVISHYSRPAYLGPMRQIALLTFALIAPALPAAAFSQEDVLSGDLRTGWQAESGAHMTALHLTMAPGWKTYWRSPGDAGIPPSFDWSGSENLRAVHFHWPRPHVFTLNGMTTVGYKNDLVLPIEVIPVDPSQPVRLKATVDLGVCDDICIPASLTVDSVIAGPGAPDAVIDAALADRPISARQAGLSGIGCAVDPISDGLRITATMGLPAGGGAETVVFESGHSDVWVSEASANRSGGTLTASAEMVPPQGTPFALDRSGVTVTVISANRAVEIRGCPAP